MAQRISSLVDQFGRPIVIDELTRDVAVPTATGIRSIWTGHPAQGLTPVRLAQLLLAAEQGDPVGQLELAEEMEEKDLHYLSVISKRKRNVSQVPITVEPASDTADDEADAQIVRDWIDRDRLQGELFDVLDGVGKGYAFTEIVWETSESQWMPQRLEWRDQRWFEFDKVDGQTPLLIAEDAQRVPLSPAKYIYHRVQAKSGLPARGGLARVAAWAYLFKNFGVKSWANFAELYGLPIRIGRYENGTDNANIRLMLNALAQLGVDATAAFPKSMEVEFIDGKQGEDGTLYKMIADFWDQQISKAVLGQTATTDAVAGGLGSGQSTVHREVEESIETADCGDLAATLNRDLVVPMVMFNRGVRKRYPRIKISRPDDADVNTALKSIEAGVEMGVPIAVSTFRKLTQIPEPKPGEALLTAPEPQALLTPDAGQEGAGGRATPGPALLRPLKPPLSVIPKREAASENAAVAETDAIDRAIDEQLGDWQRLMEPLVAPVEAAIAGCSSLEEARDILAGQLAAMDVNAVGELLARAGFGARIAGAVADQAS